MPVIHLQTTIDAPRERCFDLSRSIELHKLSTHQTNEEAVGGVTKGLIGLHQEVTWRAKHFGVYQFLTTRITEYRYPEYFVSRMMKGTFKRIDHQHLFLEVKGKTVMTDIFDFEAPFGLIGVVVSKWILFSYMKRLLEKRNEMIKRIAESDDWKCLLE